MMSPFQSPLLLCSILICGCRSTNLSHIMSYPVICPGGRKHCYEANNHFRSLDPMKNWEGWLICHISCPVVCPGGGGGNIAMRPTITLEALIL